MADLSFISEFEKKVRVIDGVESDGEAPRYWFSSGNYAFNYVMTGNFHGAVPQGRVVALAGPSGSGKSFVQCNITREAQAMGAYVLMIDTESALDEEFTSKIGINVEEGYNYKSVVTIDNVYKVLSLFINGYRKSYGRAPDAPKVLVVIDSLDMLLTESEAKHFEKGENAGDQGQRAKQLKALLRQLVQSIKGLNITILVTSQVYAAKQEQILKGEGVWVINDAIRYSLSTIALLTRLKLKDGANVTGIRMKAEGFKTRFTQPFQNVTIEVPYETGMDPCSGLVEMMESVGVLETRGAYKQIKGTDTKFYAKNIADHLDAVFAAFDALSENEKHVAVVSDDVEVDTGESQSQHKQRRNSNQRLQQAIAESRASKGDDNDDDD